MSPIAQEPSLPTPLAPERDALLSAIVESARDYALITLDAEGVITSWNRGAELLLGWTDAEALGANAAMIFTPEDREANVPANEISTALSSGRAEDERWHVRKDGTRFWGSGVMVPLRSDAPQGFLKIMRDRTAVWQAMQDLKASEARFRTLVEHIPQIVWRAREMGERTWSSPQWSAFTGLAEEDSRGLAWLAAVHPADRHATMEAWREAERRGAFHVAHRMRCRADGDYRWMQSRATRLADRKDAIVEWFGTSTDVHEMRRMQDQQKVLLRELHHRSRNLLAIINSIARRTAALSTSVADFEEHFVMRIAALARVQGLVSRDDREELDLAELVRAEVSAHGVDIDGKISIDGEPVMLRERAAETVALALHELATNAVKYGALAYDAGRLSIAWRIRDDGWLVLAWRETGVPMSGAVPLRRGYGRELLEVGLPHALGAQTQFEIMPDGIACQIELPEYERDNLV